MAKPRPAHPTIAPIVVTVATAMEMTQSSRGHIMNLLDRGELRRVTVGESRAVRIPVADIYAIVGLDADNDLTEYAERRVAETCAAQGIDTVAPESVRDVVAALIGGGPVEAS